MIWTLFCRESRYLLFLTENYAALRILQIDILFDMNNPPFVLFGSSFPKDREYTQVLYTMLYYYVYMSLKPTKIVTLVYTYFMSTWLYTNLL